MDVAFDEVPFATMTVMTAGRSVNMALMNDDDLAVGQGANRAGMVRIPF